MQLSLIEQLLLFVMISGLMLGIGSSLSRNEVIQLKNHKIDFLIALVFQYLFMPLWAISLSKALSLPSNIGFTLLLIACCPGGTTSNMFTYFSRGNVSFSLALTTITSLFAFIMTPSLLSLYGSSSSIEIPAKNIFFTISVTLIPIIIGFIIKMKSRTWGVRTNKIGNFLGQLAIFVMILIWAPKIVNIFSLYDKTAFLAIGLMSLLAITFSLIASLFLNRPIIQAKTISLETGIQNAPLAFVIVQVNYGEQLANEVGWVPLVYGALSVANACAFTLLTLFYQANSQKKS